MPKLKTHKATAKRYRYTGRNKVLRRSAGQDHFNSRDTGVVTQAKRRDRSVNLTTTRAIKKLTPYH